MALCRKLSFAVYMAEKDMDAPAIYVRIPKPGKAPIHGERKLVEMVKYNDPDNIDYPKHARVMTPADDTTYVGTVDVPEDVYFVMYEMSPRHLNLLFMDSDQLIKTKEGYVYEQFKYSEWRMASMEWGRRQVLHPYSKTASPQPEEIVQSPPEPIRPKHESFAKKLWKGFRGICKL